MRFKFRFKRPVNIEKELEKNHRLFLCRTSETLGIKKFYRGFEEMTWLLLKVILELYKTPRFACHVILQQARGREFSSTAGSWLYYLWRIVKSWHWSRNLSKIVAKMLEGTIWGKQTGQHIIFSHCFVSLTDKIDFECVYGSHRICSLFSTWRFDVLSGRKSHAINFTLWIAIGVKLSLYHWIIPDGQICISIFEPDDCEF